MKPIALSYGVVDGFRKAYRVSGFVEFTIRKPKIAHKSYQGFQRGCMWPVVLNQDDLKGPFQKGSVLLWGPKQGTPV